MCRHMRSSSTLSLFPCGLIMRSKINRNDNQLPLAIVLNGSFCLSCRFNVRDDANAGRHYVSPFNYRSWEKQSILYDIHCHQSYQRKEINKEGDCLLMLKLIEALVSLVQSKNSEITLLKNAIWLGVLLKNIMHLSMWSRQGGGGP